MNSIYIVSGARTPFATWSHGKTGLGVPGGALKNFDQFDLGASSLKTALKRAGLKNEQIDKIIFSNSYHPTAHACYGARYVGLRAGLPETTPALTVSLACGSGLFSFISAAQEIALGEADLIAAGGSDNISLLRRDVFVPSFTDISINKPIGLAAEELAIQYNVSRPAQDAWAWRSHQKARQARMKGLLNEEIGPTDLEAQDDWILESPTIEHFQNSPAFSGDNGLVTKANTHGLVDGASALIFASEKGAASCPQKPWGRYLAGSVSALEPGRMSYASVPAIKQVLSKAKLNIDQIDLFEINETFAAQTLIDLKELNIPEEKVNVNGGAIALGHPFAATGGRLILGLLLELKRRSQRHGIASICVGGGQGVAIAVERL